MVRGILLPHNCSLRNNIVSGCRRNAAPPPIRRWRSSGESGRWSSSAVKTTSKAFGIGSLAGICGSLAGMGGGFLMVPLMTSRHKLLGLSLSQHQAHATSLFAVATTGLAGALSYHSAGSGAVDTEVAACIALSGMASASLGARLSQRLSQKALRSFLGAFMLVVAPTIPAKDYLLLRRESDSKTAASAVAEDATETSTINEGGDSMRRYLTAAGIGCFSGFLAGVFGVGGGAVVVPALSLGMDMSHYQALGTSLCAMVPTAVVGTLTHMSKGTVAMKVAPGLALGAFCGGLVGGNLGLSIPEQQLKYGFSATMVFLGIRTILK